MTNSIVKATSGFNALKRVKETFDNPNATKWDKFTKILDPHERIYQTPDSPEKEANKLAKFKSRKKPTGMKKGGKTKVKSSACCRGMGAATSGGGYKSK